MKAACPSELELAGAVDTADEQLEAHLETCGPCSAAREDFVRSIELARELPLELPSPIDRARMRATLIDASSSQTPRGGFAAVRLAAGTTPPPLTTKPTRRTRSSVAVVAALAAAVVLWLVRSQSTTPDAPAPHTHGSVRGAPGARFTLGHAPDEIVRLEDGVIRIDVAPLHPGERFRVVIGDAEIEVRGTSFEVAAKSDHLVAVEVSHGRVEVRPAGYPVTTLGAGQAWRPTPEHVRSDPPLPAVVDPPKRVERPGPRPPTPSRETAAVAPRPAPPPVRSPEELAYDEAWTAMRAGNFARAAAAFSRVFILAPDGSLAEDAGFWHAVSLARGNRATQAVNGFRDFLRAHPRSGRAGEASAMLGWLLVDASDYGEAERRFRDAASDPSPAVRASAREGLAAISARSTR